MFTQTLDVKATELAAAKVLNDYQLWMVPSDGNAPISLGLLPQKGQVSLAEVSQFDSLGTAAIAASLEPLGGSPTGAPSEVLFVSELVLLC